MGFVLPYTHETLSLANCFPEASDNYPDLFEAVDQLLEQRFSYEDGTWNVDIPELGFEGTFEEESVNLGLKSAVGAWTTELDFSDIGFGELNFEWSGPADVFGAYGDKIGQTYAIKADFANLAATIEVETENDGDTMTDEFEVKVNLDQGSTATLKLVLTGIMKVISLVFRNNLMNWRSKLQSKANVPLVTVQLKPISRHLTQLVEIKTTIPWL